MKVNHFDVIVLLSGGIDSSSCINYYLSQELKPIGLFIDYGQAVAKRELSSAKQIARYQSLLQKLMISLYLATLEISQLTGIVYKHIKNSILY